MGFNRLQASPEHRLPAGHFYFLCFPWGYWIRSRAFRAVIHYKLSVFLGDLESDFLFICLGFGRVCLCGILLNFWRREDVVVDLRRWPSHVRDRAGKLAAIIGQDGSVWSQTDSFPTIKPEEVTTIVNDFANPGSLAPTGLFIGGTKYTVIQGEPGAVIRGKKVLSCSCDGFIRCMDIEKEVFDMLYTNDRNIMLSAICCAPHGYQSVYFAEAFGEMKMLDLRVGGVSNSYDLHEKKINTIDFHPHNPHLVSTSSTDCTASIWDVRNMGKRQDCTASIWDVRNMGKRQTKSIATVRHNRAVLSAYFSPSGNYLATTSYDHNVGLSNGLDSWNTTLIYHYNPPRRWISPFRAIWGWDDQYLFIGNMEKALDAICTSTKITTTLRNPLMTAIPTRFATHPFSCGTLAGATAGGRVYVWRKH